MTAKKKLASLSSKAVSKKKAGQVKGGSGSQVQKRLNDHYNEMRRNWAP